MFNLKAIVLTALIALVGAQAEQHTIHFNNKCGSGKPTLVQNGKVLSTGDPYTSNGPLVAAIAYLQKGDCSSNGEHCTLVEATLQNPTSPGSGSSSDISLIPPHTFSVASGFKYFNGCDGKGTVCNNANCPTAFHKPDDTPVQVACQADNVSLEIDFC